MSTAAILLDRDGTIIVDRDYLADPAGVTLATNAVAGLRRLAALGWPLVVITNQSGIGRGYFAAADVDTVNARVAELLAADGIAIAGWYVCPHAPDDGCDCRKPFPGLALAAARDLDLDLTRSVVIGDKRADLGVAAAVGAIGILVRTGHGDREADGLADAHVCDDLLDAAQLVERLADR